MTEINYRLECLKNSIDKYDKKRIALYGIGANAKAILRDFTEQNIIALLDEKHTGEYLLEKKVISLEEAVLLQVEVIIIAAEALASEIISERIRMFCYTHSIVLLNMYGMDEIELKRQILEQDLAYRNFSENDIYQQIERNNLICFQLMDVLCTSKYCGIDNFLKEYEKYSQICNLAENRLESEKILDSQRPFGINDIYNKYWAITLSTKEQVEYLEKHEEYFFVRGIIPKIRMVDILNRAFAQGKKIYIISDLYYSKGTTEEILKRIGVNGYHAIIQENIAKKTMSDGALRYGLNDCIEKSALYIGTVHNSNLMLAQAYGMEVCIVKTAWDILLQFSDLDIFRSTLLKQKDKALYKWVQKKITSPFVEDSICHIKYVLSNRNEKCNKMDLKLFALPKYNNVNELNVLSFPTFNNPSVSIIIPVYNHFEYTYNCLKAILYNTIDIEYEILVANDASTDDTMQLCDVVKGIRVFHNEKNLFFLRNCNEAAKYAEGKYLVFLNNDTQVQYNWLKPMVKILQECSDVGLVGSKLVYPDGTLQEAGGIIWKDGEGNNYGRGDIPCMPEYNYVKEVDYITGASIITRKELWDRIGGFDQRYAPAYCEDSDFAFEVRKQGKKVIYQPESVVIHFESISNRKDMKEGIRERQIINVEKLRKKWGSVLCQEHYRGSKQIFAARERKLNKKTILVISKSIPKYDYDSYSKSLLHYLKLFLDRGYLVKFASCDFKYLYPYTYNMQQMGIEVLYGDYYKKGFEQWILEYQSYIEYVFVADSYSREQFIDILKCTSIKGYYFDRVEKC